MYNIFNLKHFCIEMFVKNKRESYGKRKKYFVFPSDYVNKSLENLENEDGYDTYVKIIEALGKK